MENQKPEEVIAAYVDNRVRSALKKDEDDMDITDAEEDRKKLSSALSRGMPKKGDGGSGVPRDKKPPKQTSWKPKTERPMWGPKSWRPGKWNTSWASTSIQGKGKGNTGWWYGGSNADRKGRGR